MKAVDRDVDNVVSGVWCRVWRDHGHAHLAPCCAGLGPGFKLQQCVECEDEDQEEAGHRHSAAADAGLQMALLILSAVPAISDTTQIYTILLSPSFLNN